MVKRMSDWKPMGSRQTGRPRNRWSNDVCKCVKVTNVNNYKELVLNRKA